MRKKLENWLNRENRKKNNRKNQTKKNQLNRLNFWKNRLVRFGFGFINKKPKKPNRNRQKTRKKPSQTGKTEPNRFEPVFALKNQTEPNRNRSVWPGFGSVSVFFSKKKISVWLSFLIKIELNRKWSLLMRSAFNDEINNREVYESRCHRLINYVIVIFVFISSNYF